ncbi:MAG: hypothetical protein FD165_2450 [Gammaproteobacteria bacterium]|nr:MAG: hypothetical protein FD165_2450 [Gammaproteobacteria bacterium]TND03636.1 MAG: hypothetical protein FD120_1792 [Gammaproteobacteria bacterium]
MSGQRAFNSGSALRQRGSATLVVSVALLLAITVMVFFTARTSLLEQRIASNDYRGQQAFEAAEAGLEYAIGRMNATSPVLLNSAATFADAGFDCNPSTTPITADCLIATPLVGGATFKVSLTKLDANFIDVRITSKGYSDDQSAMREITMQVSRVPLVGNPPPYPLVTRKKVELNGAANVTHPPSGPTDKCIWSGETALAPPSGCQTNQNDANLKNATEDGFFTNFFLLSKTRVKSRSQVIDWTSNGGTNYSTKLDEAYAASARIIWINGEDNDVVIDNSHGDLGTAGDPVILIIEKFTALTIRDNVTVNGLVYIAGDWDNGIQTATINGIALVEGDVKLDGFLINYDTDAAGVINRLPNVGDYARIPGSWRDF